MKNFISILSAGLLLLGAVSCVKEEHRVFDPSKATLPVLTGYSVDEETVAVTYTPASFNQDFNQNIPVSHSLILASVNGKAVNVNLSAEDSGSALSVKTASLSRRLAGMGYAEGDVVSLDLFIRAMMRGTVDNGSGQAALDSDGHASISDFEIVLPKGSPYIDYTEDSPWSVIGSLSAYGINWDGDLNMWTDGSNHVAAHVTLKAGDEFKFRQDLAWTVNVGGDFAGLDNEFAVTQDGPNIVVGADGVYDLFVNPSKGIAWISTAFDPYPEYTEISTWSVIGALPAHGINWDGDLGMITDGTWHVATGVTLGAADEFKFRQDMSWTVNMGGDFTGMDNEFSVTQDGPNIVVGADGVYDLFVNPGSGLAKVTATTGAKISSVIGSVEPEPEPSVTGWNIIGLNGDWDNDILATQNGNVWSVYVTATDATTFKWRKDGDWAENYGGTLVTLGEPFEAVSGGSDISVPAGFYLVELNLDALTITVSEGNVYSLIGEINGDSWSSDIFMTEKDGIWTSVTVNIEGGFKIRHNTSWADADVYGAEDGFTAEPGVPFTAVQPGSNISVAPGQYKVQFNPATKEVLIGESNYPDQLYMIGSEFGGWDWNSDGVVEMTPVLHNPDWGANAEGQFWTVRWFTAGEGFKFCSQRAWNGDFWGLTYNDGFTEAGGNCTVSEDGFYLVHIDFKNEKVHVEPARIYGIGDCFGGWTEGMEGALFTADGKTLKATLPQGGNLRMYAASSIATSDWWTREFNLFDGKIEHRLMDELAAVPAQAGQEVVLDFNAGTGEIKGEGEATVLPTTMYIIGDGVGGWDWGADYIVDMTPVNGKAGQFWAIRSIEAGKGFKFCAVKEWSGDFYSLGDDSGYTVDGGNCYVAENGVYMIYVDTDNKKIVVEKARVYGIGDCFGGWTEGMEGALFTEENGKLTAKTASAGELRMYAATSAATSDWWTREFILLGGQIAYRGNGGDQERVSVSAGATVTLDFNAGTGTIE